MTSLKKFRKMAGLPDTIRRWSQAADQVKAGQQALVDQASPPKEATVPHPKATEWPPEVHRATAEADGRSPEDFQFRQWPVSNVRLENSNRRAYPFYFRCNMPTTTPIGNQYDDAGNKIPDPVGMCLQSVDFRLHDADTGEKLAENGSLLSDGEAVSKPRDRQPLWNVLTPGMSIKVKLVALPDFYFLDENGSARLDYGAASDGQFKGAEVESPVYTLSMDQDGNVTVGGE